MWTWGDPIYNRDVALMGEGGLQSSFDNEMGRYNRAYQDWLQTLTYQGEGGAPRQLNGQIVHDHPAGNGGPLVNITESAAAPPTFTGQTIHDWPDPGSSTTQLFGNIVHDFPTGEYTPTPPPGILPYQPQKADLERLKQQMFQYREQNQNAYADQMGGGWTGGVLPSDMQQRFADGGQFRANPTSGVRPTNPFAQQSASFGQPGASTGASYNSGGGLGGLGGFGGSSPFQIQNPYAPR